MKQLLITIAAVVLVGCGDSQPLAPTPELKPIKRVEGAKAPDISLFDAAAEGNIEAVKKHLAAGTALQHENNVGWTSPLHQAAGFGHKEIVEILIANGADVNTKGYKGSTPLDDAIGTPSRVVHPETADLLRKYGGKTGKELKAADN